MITLTDAAKDRILKVMEMQGRTGHSLRVRIAGRGAGGYRHELGFVGPGEETPDDTVIDEKGITLVVDKGSADKLQGTSIDYVENLQGAGFVVENPNPVTYSHQAKGETIQKLFEDTVNPGLAMHGGSVELLDVKDNNVYVRLGGGCLSRSLAGCRRTGALGLGEHFGIEGGAAGRTLDRVFLQVVEPHLAVQTDTLYTPFRLCHAACLQDLSLPLKPACVCHETARLSKANFSAATPAPLMSTIKGRIAHSGGGTIWCAGARSC